MISFAHRHCHTHMHNRHSPHRVTSTTHQIQPADLSTESESHSPSPSHRSTSLPDTRSRPSVLRKSHAATATTTIHECTPPQTTTHDDARRTPFSPRTTTHNRSFRLHQSSATQPSSVLLLQPAAPHQSSLSLSCLPVLLSELVSLSLPLAALCTPSICQTGQTGRVDPFRSNGFTSRVG